MTTTAAAAAVLGFLFNRFRFLLS